MIARARRTKRIAERPKLVRKKFITGGNHITTRGYLGIDKVRLLELTCPNVGYLITILNL